MAVAQLLDVRPMSQKMKLVIKICASGILLMVACVLVAAPSLQIFYTGSGQVELVATNLSPAIGKDVIEMSTNILTWTPIVTNRLSALASTNYFECTNIQAFYRVRQ